jgi:hypothetical protein
MRVVALAAAAVGVAGGSSGGGGGNGGDIDTGTESGDYLDDDFSLPDSVDADLVGS